MRAFYILSVVALVACHGQNDSAEDPSSDESAVTSASSTINGTAALGLREDLLDAMGTPAGTLDFRAATVPGSVQVLHNYSIEKVNLTATSWSYSSEGLRFPNILDAATAANNAPAKKLWDAMKNAKETQEGEITHRTSKKGLVECNHSSNPEQYDCTLKSVGTVGQQRSAL
jgi:hypothetical protein